jgi:hypothetical protein
MPPGALSDIIGHIRRLALRADVTGLEDRLLLERFLKERDEEAFQALVRRHGPMIFAVCRRFLKKSNQERFEAGRIPIQDLWESRYHRVQTELALEPLKSQ